MLYARHASVQAGQFEKATPKKPDWLAGNESEQALLESERAMLIRSVLWCLLQIPENDKAWEKFEFDKGFDQGEPARKKRKKNKK